MLKSRAIASVPPGGATLNWKVTAPPWLLVAVTVIPEAAYLMRKRLGAAVETRFAESLAASEIAVENLTQRDIVRCAELLHIYDFLGFVDASIVAIAERLKLRALVTTDRRDFARVRPTHVAAFQLLP